MWRAGVDPRTRSAGVLIEILDLEPDWDRLVAALECLTVRVPRLRERVLEPPLPLVTPTWSHDPHFDLRYHLQRFRLPVDGLLDDVNAIAALLAAKPFDAQRPPWEAVLVGGLPDGQAAFLFKCHHSLTDGLGMLQLLDLAHSHGREPSGAQPHAESNPPPQPRSASRLLVDRLVTGALQTPEHLARAAAKMAGRVGRNPIASAEDAIRYGRSLGRVMASPPVARSPLLRGGGIGYRFASIDVPIEKLKSAGQAACGTVNDTFLAALLGGIRLYHEQHGVKVDQLPMAIPVSVRSSNDPMGGNRFTAARFIGPVGETDPRQRIATVHQFVTEAREEPALNFVDVIAPILSVLPLAALTENSAKITTTNDVQASNMGKVARTLYYAGAKVLRLYPVGPRPGVALMATMLTYEDTCCIGLNFDPTAIADHSGFVGCIGEGFDEVLQLARSGNETTG